MRTAAIFLLALLLFSLAAADAGPSPPSPDVSVSMQKSDGSPDPAVTVITYHCMGSNSTDNGAVTQRLADLPCAGGKCRNNGAWFYKFNPSYNFPEGYFSYALNGNAVKTDYFSNTPGASGYSFVVDSESGKITNASVSNIPYPLSCCLPSLVLSVLVAATFIAGKR
jgi:hypothetical protein